MNSFMEFFFYVLLVISIGVCTYGIKANTAAQVVQLEILQQHLQQHLEQEQQESE
jgi:hypothetical protein